MTDSPKEGKPGHFTLKRNHNVWFVPGSATAAVEENPGAEEGQEGQGTQNSAQQSAAKLVGNAHWKGHSTHIIFSVKIAINEIKPIRPQAILEQVSPKKCFPSNG